MAMLIKRHIMWILGVSFLLYISLRMWFLSMTIDEALTYEWHVTAPWWRIFLFKSPGLPDNNHVLYTLLAKLSVDCFGLSAFSLRLPCLLGASLFGLGLALILKNIDRVWLKIAGFLVIGLNPFVVDFLAIARGYGLATGIMMCGLGVLFSAADGFKIRDVGRSRLALLLFGLSALAHLTFVLVFEAALSYFFVAILMESSDNYWKSYVWTIYKVKRLFYIMWPALPILAYLPLPFLRFGRSDLVRVLGDKGFWPDTVVSILNAVIYQRPEYGVANTLPAMETWVILTCILAAILFLFKWNAPRRLEGANASFMTISFFVVCVSSLSVIQVFLLKTAYLSERRGLFFIPMFLILAIYTLNAARRVAPKWFFVLTVAIEGPALAYLVVHNLLSLNLSSTYDWPFDASTAEIASQINKTIGERWPNREVKMKASWVLGPPINFYKESIPIKQLIHVNGDGLDEPADLYAVLSTWGKDVAVAEKYADEVIANYPASHVILLARREAK